jgi:hypothetical protein
MTPCTRVPRHDGNDAVTWRPGKLWSLWDMIVFDAKLFLQVIEVMTNWRFAARSTGEKEKEHRQ